MSTETETEINPPEINVEGKSFKELHNLGGRSYGLQKYSTAVLYFSKASELGVKELGDQLHDDLGNTYLLYGKSLLELARLEGDPLGDNVPKEVPVGEEEAEEEEEEEENEGDDKNKSKNDEGDNKDKNVKDKDKNVKDKDEKVKDKDENVKDKDENVKDKDESVKDKEENVEDEEGDDDDDIDEEEEEEADDENEIDNSKNEEIEGIELNGEKISSTSEDKDKNEGCSKNQSDEGVEEEEEPSDLQLAWEILELAKIIFTKRENEGKSLLADTLITLGEIAMESENVQSAINDIKEAVKLLETLDDKNNRMLAEAYYKLGMAVAMENKLDEAVEFYNKSKEVLENRIKDLEGSERSIHKREVEEMKKIVPEIEEKVADLRIFKEEQIKKLEESSVVVPTEEDPNKKPNDISHLVKRKRKSDVDEDASCSNPPKKPSLD